MYKFLLKTEFTDLKKCFSTVLELKLSKISFDKKKVRQKLNYKNVLFALTYLLFISETFCVDITLHVKLSNIPCSRCLKLI